MQQRLTLYINRKYVPYSQGEYFRWANNKFGENDFGFDFRRRTRNGKKILPSRFKFRHKKDLFWF